MLIHQSHNPEILFTLTKQLIITGAPAYTYKTALATCAQSLSAINHLQPFSHRTSLLNNHIPSTSDLFWQISYPFTFHCYLIAVSSQITVVLSQETSSSTRLSVWDVCHNFSKVLIRSLVPAILRWLLWP